ncbi:SUN domain-containing ossification factor [Bienertia sinuspersici]
MIVTGSRAFFFRITRPRQFTNSYVLCDTTKQFQGYQCYHSLNNNSKQSKSKGFYFPMGWNRKRKTVNPVWRPVSTQCTSNEDCPAENIMVEPENAASIEQGVHENCVVSVVTAVADSTISSSSLQAENEGGEAEGVQASHVSSGGSELKDAEGVSQDSMTASALRNSFGDANADSISIIHKDKLAVSVERVGLLYHAVFDASWHEVLPKVEQIRNR